MDGEDLSGNVGIVEYGYGEKPGERGEVEGEGEGEGEGGILDSGDV